MINGLLSDTDYYFKVAVYNFALKFCVSNEISLRTRAADDTVRPSDPGLEQPTEITGTTVRLVWHQIPETDFASYQVWRSIRDTFEPDSSKDSTAHLVGLVTNQATTDYLVTGLNPETMYCFRVLSVEIAGNRSPVEEGLQREVRTKPPV